MNQYLREFSHFISVFLMRMVKVIEISSQAKIFENKLSNTREYRFCENNQEQRKKI